MDFRDILKKDAQDIEKVMQEYLDSWLLEVKVVTSSLYDLHKTFVDSNKGGKRIRGFLVKLGFELAQNSRGVNLTHLQGVQEILKVSSAVEIFQTAILAHDDIIDQSPTRRGEPTIYMKLGGDHYGISQTISLGDIGFFLSLRQITSTNFSAPLKNKAILEFSQMFLKTGLGEMLDVELDAFSKDEILTIYKFKTAYYGFVYPLTIGLTLGGADQNLIQAMRTIGEKLGIAYQIHDDILGIFGTEKALGKSVKTDIEEGKHTLLMFYALENGTKEQKEFLKKVHGKKDLSDFDLEKVKEIFEKTKALRYCQDQAELLVDEAKKLISQLSQSPQLLIDLADFLIERNR